MAGLDLTSFDAAMRRYYDSMRVENQVYRNRPFFAMVPKDEKFYGNLAQVLMRLGNPQNRAADFATANDITSQSIVKAWELRRVSNYSTARVSNEVMKASANDLGAMLQAAVVEMDGAIDQLSRDLSISLYRAGRGVIGQISNATTGTAVATLSNPADIVNFEVGQKIVAAAAATGTITLRNASGTVNSLTVIAVDRYLGTVTFDAAMDSFASGDWAQNDYLFVKGDVITGTSTVTKMSGLQAWLPYDNRASLIAASFFGVTRSSDPTRLAGQIHDGTKQSIEEALIDISAKIALEGGKPDYAFIHYNEWRSLVKSLGSKVQYVDVKAGSKAQIGFRGVVVNGANSDIVVVPDMDCPSGRGFVLQMDTWSLKTLGPAVEIFDGDGTSWLRASSADALDMRCTSYGNLCTNAAGYNGQVVFS